MTDPVAAWHAEHHYFNRLLGLLQKQLDVFHGGERPNYELMLDIVSYLRDYSDASHHPREDVAFMHLEKHCPDLALVLARLNQEHRVIAHAGETLRDLLQGIVDGAIVSRAEVEVAAATYLVYYGNHIAKEEEDVLGRAGESLTASEWEDVKNAVPPAKDPLTAGASQERYQELRRQIALET
ncbi:MAG: hemerythrin domain-containing protein [Proteobacteria bacterium]|nr:hemerythrin domain-containing protein [Pseudomonadota bacterium]